MAFLGRRQEDEDEDERGGETFALNLDDLVCPTCGRELPPWVSTCPDDGTTAVPRAQTSDRTPDIPDHLLDGLEDVPAPAAEPADDGTTDREEDDDAG